MKKATKRGICGGVLMAGLLALSPASPVRADTRTVTLYTSYELVGSCSGFSVDPMSFGSVPAGGDPTGATAQTTVHIVCDSATDWTLSIQDASPRGGAGDYACDIRGTNGSGGLADSGGQAGATYRLFKDAALTSELGLTPACGTATGETNRGTGDFQQVTIFGKVIGSSSIAAGTYSGSVVLIATF